MNRRKSLVLILIALFTAGALVAQQERVPGQAVPAPVYPGVPCPYPFSRTLTAPPPSPPVQDPIDVPPGGSLANAVAGSVWNQTARDKGFVHSFRFPGEKDCCVVTKATLTVNVKSLGGSDNDWVQLIDHGVSVPGFAQQPWVKGATTGQTATVTFTNIPQNLLSDGLLSFYVQDDTAVTSAELRIEGCCIRK